VDWAPLIHLAVFTFIAILVVAPLAVIAIQSLLSQALYEPARTWTLDNFVNLVGKREFHTAVWNSLGLAVVATVVATAIGGSSAIAITRFDLPYKRWLEAAMLGPLYISQLVLAFGWYVLYGPAGYVTLLARQWLGSVPWNLGTVTGMGVLGGMAMAPAIMVYCSSSLALANSSLEDAARVAGASPMRVLRSVTVPLLRPAIVYGILMSFVGGLEMLSIPLVFGWSAHLEFLTTFLLREGLGQTTPDYGVVAAAALMLVAAVVIFVIIQQFILRRPQRFVTVRGKSERPKPIDIGAWKWPVLGVIVLYLTITVVLPLVALVVRSFVHYLTPLVSPWDYLTLDNFQRLLEHAEYMRSIANSVLVSLIGAALTTAIIAIVVAVVHRSDFRWARQLEMIVMIPRAMPGMVVGIGFLWLALGVPGLGVLHGTIGILILAFTMRSLPSAYSATAPSLMQIGKELDQSGRVCGASWQSTCMRLILPIARPAFLACFILTFIHFFKEYAAAVFLFSAGSEIVGTELLFLWAKGDVGPVAALAVVQLVLLLGLVIVVNRFGEAGKPWQSS
jgi:iron(III) transport system permease protein